MKDLDIQTILDLKKSFEEEKYVDYILDTKLIGEDYFFDALYKGKRYLIVNHGVLMALENSMEKPVNQPESAIYLPLRIQIIENEELVKEILLNYCHMTAKINKGK